MSDLDRPSMSADESPAPVSAPATTPVDGVKKRRSLGRRALRWSWWLLVAIVVLLGALALTARWLLTSEAGTQRLLARIPGLSVTDPKGSLWGDFSASRVVIPLKGQDKIVLEDVSWQHLQASYDSAFRYRVNLTAQSLQARVARVELVEPPSTAPKVVPADMRLPLGLQVEKVSLGKLYAPGLQEAPLTDIAGKVALGQDRNGRHVVTVDQATWQKIQLRGHAELATAQPLRLVAHVDAQQVGATEPSSATASAPGGVAQLPWTGAADVDGPLADMPVRVAIQARDQQLQASATVTPWGAQPLSQLLAKAQSLNLKALDDRAPRTSLSGEVTMDLGHAPAASSAPVGANAAHRPVHLDAQLTNGVPASWDQGGLPVAKVSLRARSDLLQTSRGVLEPSVIELADARGTAGTLELKGDWDLQSRASTAGVSNGSKWLNLVVTTQAKSLRLRGLSSTAPGLVLSGPTDIRLQKFPLSGLEADAASSPGQVLLNTQLAGQWVEGGSAQRLISQPFKLDVKADSDWQRVKASQALALQKLEISSAQIQAAAGTATLQGQLLPEGPINAQGQPSRWKVQSKGALKNFDLRSIGVGTAVASARASRLNANLQANLSAPPPAAHVPFMQWLGQWRGQADAKIADSVLADVPVSGTVQVQTRADGILQAVAALQADSLKADVQGSFSTQAPADRWEFKLDAPNLSVIDRMASGLGVHVPALQGQAKAQTTLTGRWPMIQSQGQASASALRINQLGVQKLEAQWNVGTQDRAKVQVMAYAENVQTAGEVFSSVRAQVDGTAESHRIDIKGVRANRPSAPSEGGAVASASSAVPPAMWQKSAEVDVTADGQLRSTQGMTQWVGQVRQLLVQPQPTEPAATATTWVKAEPFRVDVTLGANNGTQTQVKLSPFKLQLLDANLSLSKMEWVSTTGQTPQLDIQAQLLPLMVAPLLNRAQPGFGWSGDLKVDGTIRFKNGGSGMVGDVQLSRSAGDLVITDDTGVQPLGLEQLNVQLQAKDGIWRVSQAVSGRNLGTLQGQQTIRTSPTALVPDAQSPLSGQLNLQISRLAALGAWMPIEAIGAGWRVSGNLSSQLRLGGRLGAPEYTGELAARNLGIRNSLEGINLTDGTLDMVLSGLQARIQQLTVKGGDGTLSATGNAQLGSSPKATVQFNASRFAVLQRVDRRVVLSGNASINMDAQATRVTGALTVDEGLVDISQTGGTRLSDDVNVLPSARVAAQAAANGRPVAVAKKNVDPATKRKLLIDLSLDAGENLRLRGRGIDTYLRGQVKVSTNAAGKPLLNGVIRAQDGTYNAYGQRLLIERGLIDFKGTIDNPRLDIEAVRAAPPGADDTAIRVGVLITGNAQDPRVRLFSEPEMSETDKLSYLVLGRTTDGLGRADLVILQRAAVALLSGNEGNGDFLSKIGIDEFSISQSDGEVRETIVKVGKQLSKNWYVGYERSLNATTGTWQVLYRIAKRFSIRAQTQQGGNTSVEVISTFRWD